MLDSEDELWVWTRDRCVAGCMLYKLRERPKSFNQRAFVNGEWENTLDNVEACPVQGARAAAAIRAA